MWETLTVSCNKYNTAILNVFPGGTYISHWKIKIFNIQWNA